MKTRTFGGERTRDRDRYRYHKICIRFSVFISENQGRETLVLFLCAIEWIARGEMENEGFFCLVPSVD